MRRGSGASIHFIYDSALKGFAASLPEQALNGLVHNPNVEYIEVDQTIRLEASQTPATWGLDRIDQHALPLNNTYTYNYTGLGVTAYIIDTGILITHTQFGGRASVGYDAVGDGRNGVDCNGHGTHVSGTVGGSTYGVAKGVTLVAVRVLNCSGSGTTSGVIAGINWVTSNHVDPAVANMSLGGSVSTSLDNGGQQFRQRRRDLCRRCREQQRGRLPLFAGARCQCHHGRRDHQHGCTRLLLELRHVPGHLRPGFEHHLRLDRAATRPPTPSAAPRWPPRM